MAKVYTTGQKFGITARERENLALQPLSFVILQFRLHHWIQRKKLLQESPLHTEYLQTPLAERSKTYLKKSPILFVFVTTDRVYVQIFFCQARYPM